MSKKRVLIISAGIEDNGIRGLGRITVALIDALTNIGYEPYLLTGAPLKITSLNSSSPSTHNSAIRRYIDHYLAEGITSPAFDIRTKKILKLIVRDFLKMFILNKIDVIANKQSLTPQHQPSSLRHYAKVAGYINFGMFYKLSARLPRRISSIIISRIVRHCQVKAIITASPFPIKQPIFSTKINIIQYIHDVMPLSIIETPPDSATRFSKEISTATRNATMVLTSSQNAKDKLQSVIPTINPRVVYPPCDPIKPQITKNKLDVLTKNELTKKRYILFMSALEERKNVVRLLKAFELLSSKTNYKLVAIGSQGYGWGQIIETYENLTPKIKKRVVFTGYVSEEDKWSLLENCALVIHPAIDEGLGIPIIESILAKKPVVATRLNSIEEFAPRGCVTYIEDPYNVFEIADKTLTCINSLDNFSADLKKGSAILSEIFSKTAFEARLKSVLKHF